MKYGMYQRVKSSGIHITMLINLQKKLTYGTDGNHYHHQNNRTNIFLNFINQ
jgi:hypothetical protein